LQRAEHQARKRQPDGRRLASTFDTTSKPALGIEMEWRNKAGFAAGGEFFYYKNDLVTLDPVTGTVASSKQQVLAAMANGKYYFHAAGLVLSFRRGGIGFANALYSGGNLKGSAGGAAFQGMAGHGIPLRVGRSKRAVQVSRLHDRKSDADSGENPAAADLHVIPLLPVVEARYLYCTFRPTNPKRNSIARHALKGRASRAPLEVAAAIEARWRNRCRPLRKDRTSLPRGSSTCR